MREKVEIESQGLILDGELWKPSLKAESVVVLCHGIPLSKPDPNDAGYSFLAEAICSKGNASLFVNFRGTGQSQGNFDPLGWYEDLLCIMRFTSGFKRRFMVGFSAGGALAIKYAALNRDVDGVAAFAAPASLSRVFSRDKFSYFIEAARLAGIIRDCEFPPDEDWYFERMKTLDSIEYVCKVSPIPLLIVHGERDELVPVEHSYELFELAQEPKEIKILAGGEHRLRKDPRTPGIIIEWLEALNS